MNKSGIIPQKPKVTISSFFGSLAGNGSFIALTSKIILLSFFTIVALGIFCLLNPSAFGSTGERLANITQVLFAKIYSDEGLKTLYVYLAVIVVDVICLGYKRSALKSLLNPDQTTKKDIYIFFLRIFGIWRYAMLLSFFLIGYKVHGYMQTHFNFDFIQSIPSYLVQSLLFLMLNDFFGYWQHRLGHRLSWYWAVHRFHHSAEKFNVLTAGRSHPLDLAIKSMFIGIPMGIIGAPVETFLALELLKSAQGKFQHSMVDWDFGFLGKYIFMSPIAHRVHHSPDPIHWDKNFGRFLVIWDRMFGTWYDGKEINTRVGLWAPSPNKNGVIYDCVEGQLNFLSLFFSKWKFRVGVLEPSRVRILSQQYRESCKRKEIEP